MARETFGAQRRARDGDRQQDENRSRLAWSFKRLNSSGWGELRFAKRIDFDVVYIEEPFMSHGFYLEGDDLVVGRFPRVTAFVTEYDQDPAGNYTGAWVAVVIDTAGVQSGVPPVPEPNYTMTHYFTFSGVALKVAPLYKIKG